MVYIHVTKLISVTLHLIQEITCTRGISETLHLIQGITMYQRNIRHTTLDTGNNNVPKEYQKHYT